MEKSYSSKVLAIDIVVYWQKLYIAWHVENSYTPKDLSVPMVMNDIAKYSELEL